MNAEQEAMLLCRVFGHAWMPAKLGEVTDDFVTPRGYREVVVVRCLRCSTARVDAWNHIGRLGSRRYLYADGYRDFGDDLREAAKPGDNRWVAAKRRFIATRRSETP